MPEYMSTQKPYVPVDEYRLEAFRQWVITSLAEAEEYLDNHHDASDLMRGQADSLANTLETLNEILPPQDAQQQ